jgi:hypothetical protein
MFCSQYFSRHVGVRHTKLSPQYVPGPIRNQVAPRNFDRLLYSARVRIPALVAANARTGNFHRAHRAANRTPWHWIRRLFPHDNRLLWIGDYYFSAHDALKILKDSQRTHARPKTQRLNNCAGRSIRYVIVRVGGMVDGVLSAARRPPLERYKLRDEPFVIE